MVRKKTAVFALACFLFSFSMICSVEAKGMAKQPQYAEIVRKAENAEALEGEYIPVLMYHHFVDQDVESGDGMVATKEELEDQLRYFISQGYRIITLEELDSLWKRVEYNHSLKGPGLQLEEKYLCITMDDGYLSNFELAYPLFQKYRTPASVFAITDFIMEQYGLEKFTWEQARKMDNSGWLKVYSHSADHIPVESGQEEEFLSCMQKSERTLTENLKKEHVKAMAYPNGQYTAEAQELLEEDGYVLQFNIEKGVITRKTSRKAIPRITVTSGMDGRDVIRVIELAAEKAFAAERVGK